MCVHPCIAGHTAWNSAVHNNYNQGAADITKDVYVAIRVLCLRYNNVYKVTK